MNSPTALIFGITGQDGAYLSKILLENGYKVFGTSRDVITANKAKLERLGIQNDVEVITTSLNQFRSVIMTLDKTKPDLVFHLAGQTSVGLSFELPYESVESILISTLNILEAIKLFNKRIKLFLPCSSDCFGTTTKNNPANETTPFDPKSPYAVAKASSYWLAKTYREAYGLNVSIGFLSNHESPLRGKHFVTSKLFGGIRKILNKKIDHLSFGNTEIIRDWGWAPLYAEAIYKIIINHYKNDFIISSGKSYSLKEVIDKSFKIAGLSNSSKYLKLNNNDIRPNEIKSCYLDSSKIKQFLNWEHNISLDEMIYKLINEELY